MRNYFLSLAAVAIGSVAGVVALNPRVTLPAATITSAAAQMAAQAACPPCPACPQGKTTAAATASMPDCQMHSARVMNNNCPMSGKTSMADCPSSARAAMKNGCPMTNERTSDKCAMHRKAMRGACAHKCVKSATSAD